VALGVMRAVRLVTRHFDVAETIARDVAVAGAVGSHLQ